MLTNFNVITHKHTVAIYAFQPPETDLDDFGRFGRICCAITLRSMCFLAIDQIKSAHKMRFLKSNSKFALNAKILTKSIMCVCECVYCVSRMYVCLIGCERICFILLLYRNLIKLWATYFEVDLSAWHLMLIDGNICALIIPSQINQNPKNKHDFESFECEAVCFCGAFLSMENIWMGDLIFVCVFLCIPFV